MIPVMMVNEIFDHNLIAMHPGDPRMLKFHPANGSFLLVDLYIQRHN